jgi:dihydrofolate synthase/folylpolyglutamate synthase
MLSVITDIALDHQEYLGETIGEIAREKAGILRPHGTVVTLPQHAEANRAIGELAAALDVRGIDAAEYLPDCSFAPGLPEQASTAPLRPNHYEISLDGERLQVRSPLAGEHQRRNLALAIAAAIELRNIKKRTERNSNSYNITNAAIEAGIASTSWPGRLEFLPPDLLLDVAHNPAGAWALRAAIATLAEQRARTLIFSCLRDKDIAEMARILFPLFDPNAGRPRDHIVFAPIDNPRAASIEDLLNSARALEIPAHAVHSSIEALTLARGLTPDGGLIVATGSIYLVGAVREAALEP